MPSFATIDEQDPLHLRIATSIRAAIVRGEIAAGEKLPLERIAKEFGVSRMPIREALIRLEREGLIVFHNRRGAMVAGITGDQLTEIAELRSILEVDVLTKAVQNMGSKELQKARAILQSARKAKGVNEVADLHWKFHRTLYEPSQRSIELDFINTLHANVDRLFRQAWRRVGIHDGWIEEHEEIVDALERGDLDAATKIIVRHIQEASDRVEAFSELVTE